LTFILLWDIIGYKLNERHKMKTQTNTERTEKRVNRFNGEAVMLTKEEARKHDEIFLHEVQATLEDRELGTGASKHWQHMRDKLSWFMKHNAKAYMVLLD
jgi:alpha-N-acetylglucosamine transferase